MIPGLLYPSLDPMSGGGAMALPGMSPDIGQIPAPAAMGANSPMPAPHQGLLERLLPAPSGYAGLLSPQDLHNARSQALLHLGASLLGNSSWQPGHPAPGFGAALGQGLEAGMGAFQQGVQGSLEQNMQGAQMRRMQALEAARQNIAAKYPSVPGETPEETINRVTNMATEYANAGDPETAGKLASLARSLREAHGLAGNKYQAVQAGDQVYSFDPSKGTFGPGVQRGVVAQTLAMQQERARIAEQNLALKRQGMVMTPLGAMTVNQQARQGNQILNSYNTQTKNISSIALGYETLKGALTQPANPASVPAILDAYARMLNPGAVVREGTQEWFKNMGSLGQRAQNWMSLAAKGVWPPDMVRNIKAASEAIIREHAKNLAVKQADARQRLGQYGIDLPLNNYGLDEFMPRQQGTASAPKQGATFMGTPPAAEPDIDAQAEEIP